LGAAYTNHATGGLPTRDFPGGRGATRGLALTRAGSFIPRGFCRVDFTDMTCEGLAPWTGELGLASSFRPGGVIGPVKDSAIGRGLRDPAHPVALKTGAPLDAGRATFPDFRAASETDLVVSAPLRE